MSAQDFFHQILRLLGSAAATDRAREEPPITRGARDSGSQNSAGQHDVRANGLPPPDRRLRDHLESLAAPTAGSLRTWQAAPAATIIRHSDGYSDACRRMFDEDWPYADVSDCNSYIRVTEASFDGIVRTEREDPLAHIRVRRAEPFENWSGPDVLQHPAFRSLSRVLGELEPIIFVTEEDMDVAMMKRGWSIVKRAAWDNDSCREWIDKSQAHYLKLGAPIFDVEGKLKLLRPFEWQERWISIMPVTGP